MTVSIRFDNVSKIYRLGSSHRSLREAIPDAFGGLLRRKGEHRQQDHVAALRDVCFEIKQGEAVGIIGPNGAGKSTTLKLIANITRPTSGNIVVDGRVSGLLELGAGFHPDLTGRENIYLNAAILGMSREEINARFDEIVAFSELERFLDTPVKRYSSGMYCRLGFAVAAHTNPEILLVDEVLAVGDVAFQSRCLKRMRELKDAGTTIIFVSHGLPRLRRLCDRAILLYRGRIVADGPSAEVIATYTSTPAYASNLTACSDNVAPMDGRGEKDHIELSEKPVTITRVTFLDGNGAETNACSTGSRLTIRIEYLAQREIEKPTFEIWFKGMDGMTYAAHSTKLDKYSVEAIHGKGRLDVTFEPLCLLPGTFDLDVAISDSDGLSKYDWQPRANRLRVKPGLSGEGLIYLPHEWRLTSNTEPEVDIQAS